MLCFGSLQPEEIIAGSLIPLRHIAFERAQIAEAISREKKTLCQSKEKLKSSLVQALEECQILQATSQKFEEEGKLLRAKIRVLEDELEEISKAEKAMVVIASCSRTEEGQRIFMIETVVADCCPNFHD